MMSPSTATLALLFSTSNSDDVPGPTKVDLHGINIFITLDQLHVKNASSCRLGSAPIQIGSSHVTLILSAPHRPDTLKLGLNREPFDFGPHKDVYRIAFIQQLGSIPSTNMGWASKMVELLLAHSPAMFCHPAGHAQEMLRISVVQPARNASKEPDGAKDGSLVES